MENGYSEGDNETMKPIVGQVIRWKNHGYGNGFCQTTIRGIKEPKRFLWFSFGKLTFTVRTLIEPAGYPDHGTPYQHPVTEITYDEYRHILSCADQQPETRPPAE